MRGRHKVKLFRVGHNEEVNLPEGWKPFGVANSGSLSTWIVARKWERLGE